MDFLRLGAVRWTGLSVALWLLGFSVCGCAQDTTLEKIPQSTAENKAQTEALRQRIAELKKQRPDVPDSVLAMQASRELQNAKGAPAP